MSRFEEIQKAMEDEAYEKAIGHPEDVRHVCGDPFFDLVSQGKKSPLCYDVSVQCLVHPSEANSILAFKQRGSSFRDYWKKGRKSDRWVVLAADFNSPVDFLEVIEYDGRGFGTFMQRHGRIFGGYRSGPFLEVDYQLFKENSARTFAYRSELYLELGGPREQ